MQDITSYFQKMTPFDNSRSTSGHQAQKPTKLQLTEKLLLNQTDQYDVPLLLCQPYINSAQSALVEVFENYIAYDDKQELQMGFITSVQLSELEPILFSYGENTTKRVRVVSSTTSLIITHTQFLQIYDFNAYLGADWFKVADKNMQKYKRSSKDYMKEQEFPFRTYLFYLVDEQSSIDFKKMNAFASQRQGIHPGVCLFDKYLEAKDKDRLNEYYEGNIFYSQVHKTLYSVVRIINNIWVRTIPEFFKVIKSLSEDELSMDQILEYYDISNLEYDLLKNLKIGYFLYEHDKDKKQRKVPTIDALRDNVRNYQDSLDYKSKKGRLRQLNTCPLAVVEYTQSIRSLQMFESTQFSLLPPQLKREFSIRKSSFKLKKPIVQLIPIIQLHQLMLNVEQMNQTVQLPMIMLEVEKQVVCKELEMKLGLNGCSMKYLSQSIQTSSYNPIQNYEVLECVGDSVLKYIATLVLYLKYESTQSESFMSNHRVQYISNNVLGMLAAESNLHYFVKMQVPRYNDWMFPIFVNIEVDKEAKILMPHKQQLAVNQLADVYEAILGAVFVSHYSFMQPFQFLTNTFNPVAFTALNQKYLEGPFLIEFDAMECDIQEYQLEATYLDLVGSLFDISENEIKIINLQKSDFVEKLQQSSPIQENKFYKWLEYFQTQILGYRFRYIELLIEALTFKQFQQKSNDYQNLEFLGDAVLECLIVGNIYHLFDKKQIQVNPLLIHRVKLLLLTNQFMARLAVLKGFHIFVININQFLTNDIDEFAINCDFQGRFNTNTFSKSPKFLSDVWESVCGAVLIDGGWGAVIKTYGQFYKPFLLYTAKYVFEIQQPAMDRILQYANIEKKELRTNSSCVGSKFQIEVVYDNMIIGVGSDLDEKKAKEIASLKACEYLQI